MLMNVMDKMLSAWIEKHMKVAKSALHLDERLANLRATSQTLFN